MTGPGPRVRITRAILVTALALGGCAPTTVVTTNHVDDYRGRLTRLFVLTNSDMGWGEPFAAAFRARFRQRAGVCGAATDFMGVSGLELDPDAPSARSRAFGADAILFITRAGGVVAGPNLIRGNYNVTLRDVASGRNVWRGVLTFGRGSTLIAAGERGRALADDLSKSLGKDGIWSGCVLAGKNDVVRSAAPSPSERPQQRPETTVPSVPPIPSQSLRDFQDLLPP